jgi:MATE family multidrug resistance protein
MKKNNLINSVYKLTAFALPISASSVIMMVTSFISMMIVALLGKDELAAGALAVSTVMTIITVTTTILYAVGILISHRRGQEKNQTEIGLVIKNGFWLALMLAFPAALALWYVDKLLLLFGQSPNLVAITRSYFHFAALGTFPSLINAVIAQFYAGIGKPRYTLWLAAISLPFTIILSYGFILGRFGLPMLGLSGITCATLIVQTVLLLGVLLLLYWQEKTNNSPYQLFIKVYQLDWSICKSIFTLGLPIGMQFGGELAAMTGATYLMGHFGATALAASQIVSQYTMIAIVFLMGITQALSLLTSEAYGKKDISLVKDYFQASIVLLIFVGALVSIIYLSFPKTLIQFYMSSETVDAHLENLTIVFFAINACLIFVDGLRHLLSGTLRGLHDSRGPMRIGIIAMWLVSLPASYLVGTILHGGPIGLRIGFFSGFVFAATLLSLRVRQRISFNII